MAEPGHPREVGVLHNKPLREGCVRDAFRGSDQGETQSVSPTGVLKKSFKSIIYVLAISSVFITSTSVSRIFIFCGHFSSQAPHCVQFAASAFPIFRKL